MRKIQEALRLPYLSALSVRQITRGANMTAALLDRLTPGARIIECTRESYRLRQTL